MPPNKSIDPPTQPRRPLPQAARRPAAPAQRKTRLAALKPYWPWALALVLLGGLATLLGGFGGLRAGTQTNQQIITQAAMLTLKEQYDLGLQDLEAGRYEVARQRFEFVLARDPSYPGAPDKLAEAMAILFATATPTPAPPTTTPTPTFDPRPVQDLFTQAQALFASQDWTKALDTLASLRQADPAYMTARVDGMMYMSLRNRGFDKIWKEGNLGGGIYDLALAEKFAPLDAQAHSSRELARLYLIGSSFWEVHPEQAVYYFGQVAAGAPGLSDASGWTANERYRSALIQYGDLLAGNKEFCSAQQQYELAMQIRVDEALQTTLQETILKCSPPSATPAPETATPTATLPAGITPTETQAVPPTTPPTTQAPPPTTQAPPPTTEAPPATTEPPPVTTEPPPVTTEPPPATTEPSPATTEAPPAGNPSPQPDPAQPTQGAYILLTNSPFCIAQNLSGFNNLIGLVRNLSCS